ncbi:Uncharacterized protein FWK35_00025539 [Aphis craccivora]|uniref:RNase H domain-containing protein n=1 Tax=Aphis craccivora TaxID=307492 RepID=A0A6G0Y4V9_APHCR|nr:Uncharacterized protein FWK35_00025539 [Aphis craccivora]
MSRILLNSRIGHSNITHSYLITKKPKPMCDSCNTPFTIEQIIINCPKYTSSRHLLLNLTTLEEALNQFNSANIFNFFKSIGLDDKLLYSCIQPYFVINSRLIIFNFMN